MEVFDVRNLTFTYPGQKEPVLKNLSFRLASGEFIALIGLSGCGKSTLLRQLKTVLAPHGERSGEILFEGKPLENADMRHQASSIGYVQQSPENQAVTDKVWHELAFGLESLGMNTPTIRLRVAETASFFGIQSWFHKDIAELSGGQKQLLNLASVMVMQPSVLILDEPTCQLDPIAAGEFLSMVGKIIRELGTTVILTGHHLEEVLPIATRVIVLDGGKIICDRPPEEIGVALKALGHPMFRSMATPMRVWAAVESGLSCPLSISEGRDWLGAFAENHELFPLPTEKPTVFKFDAPAIELDNVWFRYGKNEPEVIKGLSFKAYSGELLCMLGGNGTGKTTALSIVARQKKPYRGNVRLNSGPVAALPQDPKFLFVKKTVFEELLDMLSESELTKEEKRSQVLIMAQLCRIEDFLSRHPYDLSGGEMQRTALAKVLLLRPKVLLLDEPTKGLDAEFKRIFAAIIRKLTVNGVCVVMVSHDVEFCAEHADRCALFFDGAIVTENTSRAFFGGNSFYTTSASRMARGLIPNAVTAEEVILSCGGKTEVLPEVDISTDSKCHEDFAQMSIDKQINKPKLPLWQRLLALASGMVVLGDFVCALRNVDVTEILTSGALEGHNRKYSSVYLILIASMLVLAFCGRKTDKNSNFAQTKKVKRRLSKRTLLSALVIFIAVPLTVFVGIHFLGDRKYYFISLLVILESMLPFGLMFESRRPQARELVVIAVLCALGISGRAAFFALPGFKPVLAIVIISGVAFGGETGFLVGAITMFASNMLFGQGPWTPWQMFAMGIAGFLAGILFSKGLIQRNRLSLSIFGVLVTIIVYGGLMNPATVLMYQPNPTFEMLLAACVIGFPIDLVHAAATVTFLWFISQPLLEKLERIKVKYGLIDG
ncbi:MAG: septum site-determining protein MinC [Firmicutes bacterium HGW-Firmicutes-16]|nr:MAG: septum site-determining protein MinC [Firmicutes bacterium HGW-Firmicutes-16]